MALYLGREKVSVLSGYIGGFSNTGIGGSCGAGVVWTLDSDGLMVIAGSGGVPDYSSTYQPWINHKDSIKSLMVMSGVTRIGAYAFYQCTNLKSVSIASTVTYFGDRAFEGCENMTRVDIEDLSAWCGTYFDNEYANPLYYAHDLYLNGSSSSLVDLHIPSDVKSIGKHAFFGCYNITSLTMGDDVESIGICAFMNCEYLTSAILSNKITDLPSWAFNNTALTNIVIPDSVKTVTATFWNCDNLESVTIGSGVTEIAAAFSYCELSSATFKVTGDWKYQDNDGNYIAISASDLSTASKAATVINEYGYNKLVRTT